VGLEHRKCHKKDKLVAVIIGPQHFPQSKNILELKFAFKGDKDPATFKSRYLASIEHGDGTHRKQKNRFRPSVFSAKNDLIETR
jgi:hypothetical protein